MMILKFVHIIFFSMMYPLASANYMPSCIRPHDVEGFPCGNGVVPSQSHDCKDKCGTVDIPYPFGMEYSNCYADYWFEVECKNTSRGEKPYLAFVDLEVTSIDISRHRVMVMNPIKYWDSKSKNASGSSVELRGVFDESPFVYSENENKFLAVSCNNIAFLVSNGSQVSGCVSICDGNNKDDENDNYLTNCDGRHCCETSLPPCLSEYNVTIVPIDNLSKREKDPRDQRSWALIGSYDDNWTVDKLKNLRHVPAVLDWEIPNSSFWSQNFPAAKFAECYPTNVTSSQKENSGWRCYCDSPHVLGLARFEVKTGFRKSGNSFFKHNGNPYIHGGCNETVDAATLSVVNNYKRKSRAKWAIVGVCSSIGSIILLLGLWQLSRIARKKLAQRRQEKLFKRNGGLLLEKRLSSGEVNVDKTKLFNLKDLKKATDYFNVNRVLGKGGQGTVYKGMLTDGNIVAVKKFKVQGNIEEFINEFVILSQINHRNVVKLLGCCLETEIPLLVYEFIPNGNLSEYLHEPNDELPPMTWDMRLRIASEVAGALFYLHSAASQPIYHRDIKSTNILLDGKYKAKIADFGASRMISIEATHHTTVVQGTFGYLDPEYFHTSQLTDKSDVYSFGVVLVELLTGQRAISCKRPSEAKSLASYLSLSMEENRLFDIIDERVMKEGDKEHIIAVANLANRCLELNGKNRPTMKEVTMELERIQKSTESKPNVNESHEEIEFANVGIEDYQSSVGYSASNSLSTVSGERPSSDT